MVTINASNEPTAASGTVLQGQGVGTHSAYSTATYPATTTAFDLLCSTATNVVGQITAGATATVLTGVTGAVPAFSATPTVTSITFGSGTALSVYAEGTFTPTVDGAVSGTTTYTTQVGAYTRIGNIVYVQAFITISAATGTGALRIGALPFTVKNTTNAFATGATSISGAWVWPAGTTMGAFLPVPNATFGVIQCSGSAVTAANLAMTNAAATFVVAAVYQI